MDGILEVLWKKWLRFAEIVGNFNARVILTILYFMIFAIPSLFLTFLHDKIGKKFGEGSYYFNEQIKLDTLEEAREM